MIDDAFIESEMQAVEKAVRFEASQDTEKLIKMTIMLALLVLFGTLAGF